MGVIMHNNIPYGGGSSIEPNPQESATEQLETLGIDGDVYDVTDANAIHTSDVGVANGVAKLDSNGKVPASQLPSYVDDVIEAYYDSISDRFYEESAFTTVIPPESGKTWVDIPTNKSYRWTGSVYVRVDEGVQLGETSDTAYRGDRGKIAYDHSQSDHSGIKPAFTEAATRANIASGESFATLLGKIKKWFSDIKTVAFSGSYNDLSNKPTIPTVNDGTLTIKQNNTNLGTFTANQSTASNINIECAVPSDVEGSKTATGNPLTITDAAPIKAEQLVFEIEPIQAGSGTPSPSNIRPITGYTFLSANRCGKNWIPLTVENVKACNTSGTWSGNEYTRYGCKMTLNVDSNGFVTSISRTGKPSANFSFTICDYDNFIYYLPEGNFILTGAKNTSEQIAVSRKVDGTSTRYGTDVGSGLSFTSEGKEVNIFFGIYTTASNTNETYYPLLRLATVSDANFEPYNGSNVTVQLGQTVYGATLTLNADWSAECYVDTGVITDMSTSTDIEWENAAGLIAQGVFPFTITGADYVNQVWLSEAYNIKYQSNWNMNNGEIIVVKTSGGSVGARLQNTSYNTLAGLKASLAGQKLVYALATPFTLHLSPVETLNLLQGINNVWTDGTTLSLTYQPDNAIGQAKGTAQELVESASTWKLFAESANANIALPTNCKELYICVIYVTGSTSAIMYDFHILPDILTKATSYFRQGDYYTPDYFSRCSIRIRKTSNVYDTRVEHFYMNNTTDRAENTTVKVYYR